MDSNQALKIVVDSVQGYDSCSDKKNAVFTAMCNAPIAVLDALLDKSDSSGDEDPETGYTVSSQIATYCPDFPDYTSLGEWQGYDMKSVQTTMQVVYDELSED